MFFQNHLKGRHDWYIYVMTLILVVMGYIIGQSPLSLVIYSRVNNDPGLGVDEIRDFEKTLDFTIFDLSPNYGLFLALCIFLFAMLSLFLGLKFLHKRNLKSLINWQEKIDWKRILFGLFFWLGLSIAFESAMFLIEPENYSFHPPQKSFLLLVLIAVFILPIQTSFEEFLFRGYLMQWIGSFTQSKFNALIGTALLFAAVHSMNPEVAKYGLWNMIPYYLTAGLFLGYITIMDNRLELALGVHAATNMFGSLFVTYEGAALKTESLFKTYDIQPLILSLVFFVFGLIFILVASSIYKWKSPGEVFGSWELNSQQKD
jgi:membrane protease YdiL (CAAX protease family)